MNTFFLFGLVIISSSNAITLRKNENLGDESSCGALRCKDAEPLARRLSKLSLLPDFVTQTLLLLEDLMKEMDTELKRSASYLMDNVGPDCSSTYSILQEVLQKQRMREGRKSSSLGFGVEPVDTGMESTTSSGPPSRSHKYSPKETESQFKPIKKGYTNSHQWRGQSTNQWGSETSKQPRPGKWARGNQKTAQGGKWSESQYYQGQNKDIELGWETSGSSNYDQWDDQKTEDYHDLGGGIEQYADNRKQCKGVGKSSPFWVPGLDSWCIQNCAAGYCPETHCIC